MASEGPNYPGSVTAVGWANSTNVFVEDDTETSFTWGGGGLSNSLEVRDFGFSIPTVATVDGIEVVIRCRKPGLTDIVVNSVQLLELTGDDKGDDAHPSTIGFGDLTYGGAADDWNASPTPAGINSPNFGSVVLFESAGGGVTVDVDTIKITVYYTETAFDPATGGIAFVQQHQTVVRRLIKPAAYGSKVGRDS